MSEQAIKALQDAIEYECSADYVSQIAKLKAQLAIAEQAQEIQSARRMQLEQAIQMLSVKPVSAPGPTLELKPDPNDTVFGM
jgi:chromosome condensin MukBEF ATPase and DNA-binding subunit MukB